MKVVFAQQAARDKPGLMSPRNNHTPGQKVAMSFARSRKNTRSVFDVRENTCPENAEGCDRRANCNTTIVLHCDNNCSTTGYAGRGITSGWWILQRVCVPQSGKECLWCRCWTRALTKVGYSLLREFRQSNMLDSCNRFLQEVSSAKTLQGFCGMPLQAV